MLLGFEEKKLSPRRKRAPRFGRTLIPSPCCFFVQYIMIEESLQYAGELHTTEPRTKHARLIHSMGLGSQGIHRQICKLQGVEVHLAYRQLGLSQKWGNTRNGWTRLASQNEPRRGPPRKTHPIMRLCQRGKVAGKARGSSRTNSWLMLHLSG